MAHLPQALTGTVLRGEDEKSGSLFNYVDLEARIPSLQPVRKIWRVVNDRLASLDANFSALYPTSAAPQSLRNG